MKNSAQPFIFFLTLEDNLPQNFYKFNKLFREQGFVLLPIKIDQLQALIGSSSQEQVIVISTVADSHEYKLYNEKIRGLLKFILKSKRITFMHLSSFSKLNDMKIFSMNKNYYFVKFPIDAREFTLKTVKYYLLKLKQNSKWPGGRRAGVSLMRQGNV
ncbi:MAG: hypothetical protein AB7I27_05740 [Bacteriovoracaceae bacterium]